MVGYAHQALVDGDQPRTLDFVRICGPVAVVGGSKYTFVLALEKQWLAAATWNLFSIGF